MAGAYFDSLVYSGIGRKSIAFNCVRVRLTLDLKHGEWAAEVAPCLT